MLARCDNIKTLHELQGGSAESGSGKRRDPQKREQSTERTPTQGEGA